MGCGLFTNHRDLDMVGDIGDEADINLSYFVNDKHKQRGRNVLIEGRPY